ncbi:hypothetical protein E4U16_002389 [Claviceps sp. LM84 group G4]|nr:hypothetical protein E4U16_002389 [Claviceps sp. LM84 group G4]
MERIERAEKRPNVLCVATTTVTASPIATVLLAAKKNERISSELKYKWDARDGGSVKIVLLSNARNGLRSIRKEEGGLGSEILRWVDGGV